MPGSEGGSVGGVGREDEEDGGEDEGVRETSQASAAVVVEEVDLHLDARLMSNVGIFDVVII